MVETTLSVKTDGILPVNKSESMTSYDVIRILKKRTGYPKIGHGGTLDPMAEGVLLVLLGKACGFFEEIKKMKKTYTADIVFGLETDTDDVMGNVTNVSDKRPTFERAAEILQSFVGEIEQIPPRYSAVKYGGKKLYEYARKGITVAPPAKKVKIDSIKILSFGGDFMKLSIVCSGGTYIRALARDFGRKAGSFAALRALRREKVGNFELSMCAAMDTVKNGGINDFIIGLNENNIDSRFF